MQTLRGTIVDKESQMPLIGANVSIENSNPLLGTSTDMDGIFRFDQVPIGRQTILISYLGYEPMMINNLLITSGKEVVLTLELTESTIQLEEAVVIAADEKSEAMNEMALVSARTFSVEETSRYASSLYDPARMAQNYAGVSFSGGTSDLFNEIIVRGNSPRGVLWRLEGIEIPNPNHFGSLGNTGGGISMLSSSLLSNSDFYTAAFPAEFGNASSGVFDLNFRRGNNEKREYSLMAGILGLEAAAEGPIGNNGASYLFNVRYSSLAVMDKLGISPVDGDVLPEYGDIAFNFSFPKTAIGNINIFGLGGKNKSYATPESDSTLWEYNSDKYGFEERQTTGTIGLAQKVLIDEKSYIRTVIAASSNVYQDEDYYLDRHNEYKRKIDFEDRFDTYTYRLTSTYTRKFNARNTMKLGGILSYQTFNFMSRELDEQANMFVTYLENEGNAGQHQAYAQWKMRTSEDLTLTTGVHFNHYGLNKKSSIEPRFAAKYVLSPKQSIHAAVGVHSKPEHPAFHLIETSLPNEPRTTPNRYVDYSKSLHAVIGYDHQISKDFKIRTEAYYQYLYDVPVSGDPNSRSSILNVLDIWDMLGTGAAVNEGYGKNYGIDITVEKYYSKRYYFLTTASIFESKFRTINEQWFNTRFNSHYQLNVLGGKEFAVGKNNQHIIGVNGKFIINGGNRLTPIDLAQSKQEGYTVRDMSKFMEASAGTYYRGDIGFSYKRNRKNVTHTFMLDVQNVTNHLNVLSTYFSSEKSIIENEFHTGLFPVLNYRIEF